jgi:hypothetical protein
MGENMFVIVSARLMYDNASTGNISANQTL